MIETERLRVVPFEVAHLTERYVAWLSDPDVVRFSDQRFATHTLESCRAYWESFRGTHNHFWAVVAKDPELDHIGSMNAYVDLNHRIADVGILMGEPRTWGRGYGLEAWVAVVRWLLTEGGMRKVTAGTVEINQGMRKILERSGMVDDGRRTRHLVVDGAEVDLVHAAAFRETWPGLTNRDTRGWTGGG